VILAALLAVAVVEPLPADRERGTHIAIVGEFVSSREMNPCDPDAPLREGESVADAAATAKASAKTTDARTPTEQVVVLESMCLPLDRVYEARFRVTEPVAGVPPSSEVTFRLASHRGLPSFLAPGHALLVLTLEGDRVRLQKYMGFGVHRLAGGGWATCGQDRSAARQPPPSHPLAFAEPLQSLVGADPARIAQWREDPDVRIEGDSLYCARGVPLADYVDYLRRGVLAARGVVLEPPPQAANP